MSTVSEHRKLPNYLGCLLLLIGLALIFRIPQLLNLDLMNSDYAFLAIQAEEILNGHWSFFLWASDYQGSLEPLFAAVLFLFFGKSSLVFSSVALAGYFGVVGLTLDILKRQIGLAAGTVAVLLQVFVSYPFLAITVFPHRQWSITSVFLSSWLFNRAQSSGRYHFQYALGIFLLFFALYLDFYTIQFFAPGLFFCWLCSLDERPNRTKRHQRRQAILSGFFIGTVFLLATRFLGPQSGAPLAFSFKTIVYNLPLLWNHCLPITLGFPFSSQREGWALSAPLFYWSLAATGASLLVGQLIGGWLACFHKDIPWKIRRLGVFGAAISLTSIVGFLGSTMASDEASSRYLTPILWAAPFAISPLAYRLRPIRFCLLVIPYLVGITVSGWLGQAPYVRNFLPVKDPDGILRTEEKIGRFLRDRGVAYGTADYFVSYQMTWFFKKNPIIVPRQGHADRFAIYRQGFADSSVVAEIFTPQDPLDSPDREARKLFHDGIKFERFEFDRFSVLIRYKS